ELQSDHEQQHAQQQQGAVADGVSECLQHRQVDEDRRSERTEDEAEPPEEMQRAMAVAADERHGQEVEEPPQVALDAITRTAVLTGTAIDGELRDAEAAVVREHWNEPVQLPVKAKAVDARGAVRL